MKVAVEKLAWLAGIIDGEGCVGLYHFLSKGRWDEIRPCLMIVNCNHALILEVQNILKALKITFTSLRRKRIKLNWKRAYVIEIQNSVSLKNLYPF